MSAAPTPPAEAPDSPLPARERLLRAAARLFAERGVDGVPTREICAAAGVNPGAIHYHFGDKEGLYAEVLRLPARDLNTQLAGFDDPALPLHEAICRFLRPFLVDDGACSAQLFMREMQAPSPVFLQTVAEEIGPILDRFAGLLARHAGLAAPTPTFFQLAMGLQAMAHDYSVTRPLLDAFHPGLLASDPQLELTCRRLADWGCALVAHERAQLTAA
jgi:AcrR family transcriptional regulator